MATKVFLPRLTYEIGPTTTLFDFTLTVDTASIDTGAGGISGGFNTIEIYMILQTDDAAAKHDIDITFNNDASSIYDLQYLAGANTSSGSAAIPALASVPVTVHGSGGSASYPGYVRLSIPNYARTSLFKMGDGIEAVADPTAANMLIQPIAFGYRSTAAITRMKVAAQGSAKLKAGSRLIIVGKK